MKASKAVVRGLKFMMALLLSAVFCVFTQINAFAMREGNIVAIVNNYVPSDLLEDSLQKEPEFTEKCYKLEDGLTQDSDGYYLIYSEAELRSIDNGSASTDSCLQHNYRLMRDITLSSAWHPLSGQYTMNGVDLIEAYRAVKPFTGVFDGNGHTIYDMRIENNDSTDFFSDTYDASDVGKYMNIPYEDIPGEYGNNPRDGDSICVYGGLFAKLQGATIKNLQIVKSKVYLSYEGSKTTQKGIRDFNVYSGTIAGCVVGEETTTIKNVSIVNSNVTSHFKNPLDTGRPNYVYAGGIVGCSNGNLTIENYCVTNSNIYAYGDLGSECNSDYQHQNLLVSAGGILGAASIDVYYSASYLGAYKFKTSTIKNCYTSVNVSASWIHYGEWGSNGITTSPYATFAAGIVGCAHYNMCKIQRCYAYLLSGSGADASEYKYVEGEDGADDGYVNYPYIEGNFFQPIYGGLCRSHGTNDSGTSDCKWDSVNADRYICRGKTDGVQDGASKKSVSYLEGEDGINWLNG